MGLETPDDAAVFRLSEDLALVQTVDFFTPIVDDPFLFGQIAAANALSDIFAMGGRPLTAMNILCHPCELGSGVAVEVLRGGAEKVSEAGAVVVGGHTVDDREPKYGLAVTGTVHPERVLTAAGARPGDLLVLTKPLGTGILATALKGGFLEADGMAEAVEGMRTLNAAAAEAALEAGVSACTDVTGFGLMGHLLNMLEAGRVSCVLEGGEVPLYPRVMEMAGSGMVPAGAYDNRSFYAARVASPGADELVLTALCDPQTSGGLLLAVPPGRGERLLAGLEERGCRGARVIGRFTEPRPFPVTVE